MRIDSLGRWILANTAQPNCRRPGLDPGRPRCGATYSAGCNTGAGFFGAIQKASGRSNRKLARSISASRQITTAPATPATVTISEIAPMSAITPVFSSSVRVIAIGQDASGTNDKPAVDRSATLEVTPVDAQKLALGQQLGQLSLVLRKPGEEQNIPNVETVSFNDLRYELYGSRPPAAPVSRAQVAKLAQPRRAPPVRRAVAPAPPPTNTISVTRGVETKDYEVGGYAQ